MKKLRLIPIIVALFAFAGCSDCTDDSCISDPGCIVNAYITNESSHNVEIGGLAIGQGETKKVFSDVFLGGGYLPIDELYNLEYEYVFGQTKRIKFVFDDTLTIWHTDIFDTATMSWTTTPEDNNFFSEFTAWKYYDTNNNRSYYYFVSDNDYATAQRLNRNSDSR